MIAYAASLSGDWVYEDHRPDLNPIYTVGFSWQLWPRWMTSQSYALTTWLVGPSAWWARLVSLLWHLLNGVLLWRVARSAVPEQTAVLAAGIFLLWPIQVESVAAVAYRTELVAAMWLLLALLSVRRSRVVAWLCCAGAILGKEAGVMAFGLVPLWVWWVGPRWTRAQAIAWGVACVIPAGLGLLWGVGLQSQLVARPAEAAITAGSFVSLVGIGLWSVVQPSALSIVHDVRAITPLVGLGLCGLAAAVALVGPFWVRRAVIWIAAAVSLRIVTPTPEVHEHHLYTAWIGVSLALASVVNEGVLWRTSFANTRARYTSRTAVRAAWARMTKKPTPWRPAGRSRPMSI